MAVTVYWVEWITGESPGSTAHDTNWSVGNAHTITSVSNINLGNSSARDITPSASPIAAGSNSFTKIFALQFSGTFTQINNAKIWKSDGNYVTDEVLQFSGNIAYAVPATADAGDAAIPTSQPGVNNVGLSFADLTGGAGVGAPATGRKLPESGDTSLDGGYYSGSRSCLLRFQLTTSESTPAGPVNQKTISLTYDRQ